MDSFSFFNYIAHMFELVSIEELHGYHSCLDMKLDCVPCQSKSRFSSKLSRRFFGPRKEELGVLSINERSRILQEI